MVYGKVCFFVDRCALKLVRCYLIVACLAGYAQFKRVDFEILHECLNALRNGSEVMVVHLLVFSRAVAHECTSGKHQVGACCVEVRVYEEILLFPSQVAYHLLYVRIEVVAHVCSSNVHGV